MTHSVMSLGIYSFFSKIFVVTDTKRSDNDREISSGATSVVSASFCAGPQGVTPVGDMTG